MAKKPIEHVNVEIDDQPVKLPKDEVILWSARELGYDIPHFCAHKWLEPLGACRMCLIKVEMGGRMMPKLQASCAMRPAEGMKIWTRHDEVLEARREQLEFHLINHPLECPVCDKGGECMLQDQTNEHGCAEGRYKEQKRLMPDKILNDYIRINYKRCIHCKRCSTFTADIEGSHLLKMVDRGADSYIDSYPEPGVAPRFSGNVIDICPVGALTARNYRFTMGRPWEQELHSSVGSLDSVGANIWLNTRLGQVARIVPRQHEEIDNGLIDDATRFSWECIEDARRVRKAVIREGSETAVSRNSGEQSVGNALKRIVGEHGADSVGVVAGAGLNCEEFLALRHFAAGLDTAYYHFGEDLFGAGGADAAALASFVNDHATIDQIKHASCVLSLGCDLFDEAPSLGLQLDVKARRGTLNLLAARSHKSDFDRFAAAFAGYDFGGLLAFIAQLTKAVAGQDCSDEGAKELAAKLKDAGEDLVLIYGQEVWRAENPAALIHAISKLKAALAAGGTKVYLNPVFPAVNSVGALLATQFEAFSGSKVGYGKPPVGSLNKVLNAAAGGKLKALLIFDADLLNTYPDRALVERALAGAGYVVYCGPFANPTSELAQSHLPLGSWAHREGTVVNLEWRVQKRNRATLDASAPSVLDVVNSLAVWLEAPEASDLTETLYGEMAGIAAWPDEPFGEFPAAGVLLSLKLDAVAAPAVGEAKPVPAGDGLLLTPKRFLYNDREELRLSPVLDEVAKPFAACFHPDDLEKLNITPGAEVVLVAGGNELKLTAAKARWVLPGSVVVNDYYIGAPVGKLAGTAPVRVEVKVQVASGS